MLSTSQIVAHAAIGVLWIFVNLRFWSFWFEGAHQGYLPLYLLTTVALAYLVTGLPTFFWFYVARMRRPVHLPAPPGKRVAMVTLCVPSHESIEIIERQLRALTEVRYPHDSWVLDEGDDSRVKWMANALGVRYFSRRGVMRWNRSIAPFQSRTKAGNVNAWLDHLEEIGEDYEFFVQLDIDHVPRPDYLDRTLGHFRDPQVAWVQAPSVFGNLDLWTARGASEQDLVLHGPLQMGFYGHSRTPFIIGSHTTYRTDAIRAIGGFQPTRAEDHLDTVVLASAGYSGVYVPEVIAEGDGPEDFGTYLLQQFAWAYSMIQIFLKHMPRLINRYSVRQSLEFLVAQSWYMLWALALTALWVLPVAALLSDQPLARVSVLEFLAYYMAVIGTSTLMWWWARGWFQPQGMLLSWRGIVLEIARWPIVLWAFINVVLGIRRPYMITRKGGTTYSPASALRLYGPFLGLVAFGIGAVLAFRIVIDRGETQGYLGLILVNVAMMLILVVTVAGLELHEMRQRLGSLREALRLRAGMVAAVVGFSVITVASGVIAWAPMVEAFR